MARPQRIATVPGPLPIGGSREFLPADGILIDPSGRVLDMSPEVVRLFGRSLASLSDRVESSDGFPAAEVQEALVRARLVWDRTSQLVTLDREHRSTILVRTEILETPSGERMMAMVTDLTTLLRESDASGDLARRVRQGLRAPLASLQGAIDRLRAPGSGLLEERQLKLLEVMDKAAKQMADLVAGDPAAGRQEP